MRPPLDQRRARVEFEIANPAEVVLQTLPFRESARFLSALHHLF
jgi:hypothetical protein